MLWVQGLACGALLTFAAPMALLAGVLLAPAIACALAEQTGMRGVTRAMALCCGAAALAPAWHLLMAGDTMGMALAMLSEPLTVVIAWGAGACAWAACQVVPVLVRTGWEAREAARARGIAARLTQVGEEWDLE